MTLLRGFTDDGLARAQTELDQIRNGSLRNFSHEDFAEDDFSYPLEIELPHFDASRILNRWNLALWLHVAFVDHADQLAPPVWSWLAVHLFDVICPPLDGQRKVRESARYILQADDYRKAYRHLLAGPYLLFTAHADDPSIVRGLLATSPDAPGEVYEQLASRKFLVTSRAVVSAATALYLNDATGNLRRGAGGSGPGSPRRFGEVLQQFDRTYDLQTMSPETLLSILPSEFNRFIRS